MQDWDFISVGMILIGGCITVAGIIIAALLLGIPIYMAPFLLLITALLIVLSVGLIIYYTPKTNPPI